MEWWLRDAQRPRGSASAAVGSSGDDWHSTGEHGDLRRGLYPAQNIDRFYFILWKDQTKER